MNKVVAFSSLYLLAFLLVGSIFLLDLKTDGAANIGVLYTLAVLYSYTLPGRFAVHGTAILTSILILVVQAYSNHGNQDFAILSSFFRICAIWVSLFIVLIARRGYNRLEEINTNLDEIIFRRTKDLRENVVELELQQRKIEAASEEIRTLNRNLINERKEVVQSNVRFANLMETAQLGLVTTDRNLTLLSYNRFFEELYGVLNLDSGVKLIDLISREDKLKFATYFHEFLDTENEEHHHFKSVEVELTSSSAEEIPVEIFVRPLLAGQNSELAFSIIDLTERKQREETRRRAREAEVRNQEVEHMAYLASHDLQEPLRTVEGFINILEIDFQEKKLGGEMMSYLDYMRRAIYRMSNLIKYMLQYSKIGTIENTEVVALNKLIEDLKLDLKSLIQRKKAKIEVGDLPAVANANSFELNILFQNLMSNALKFIPKDRSPHIRIGYTKRGNEGYYFIKDNGIGIPEKDRKKIFLMFQRLHGESRFEGTGIGLAFCKKIVEQYGGKMELESEVGEGTTFYFSLNPK
jgi:PAS domain S-box-containing protein